MHPQSLRSAGQQARWIRPASLLAGGLMIAALVAAVSSRMGHHPDAREHATDHHVQLESVACHTSKPSEPCHSDVMFVKKKFIKEHPEWYVGLTRRSSFKDIQAYLNKQKDKNGKPRCPMPCDYTPTSTRAPTEAPEGSCHSAKEDEKCYRQIENTRKNIADHPDWYGGLTEESSDSDIQEYLHEQHNSACPRPCDRDAAEAPDDEEAKKCRTAVKGEECWDAIQWVRSSGYEKHPEWFKGITAESTPEEIQNYLAGRNGSHCDRPACQCHTALPGEDCFTHVSFTIKALPKHPDWYPGLSENSSVKEVQAFMYQEKDASGKRVCPFPCGMDHDKQDKHKHRCHTTIPGEACYHQVLWAMDEVRAHPEWYPGLNSSSSVEEFQAWLHLGKKDSLGQRCPIPCNEEAMEAAKNNSEAGPCHIAQKGEPCHRDVLEVHEDLKKHPDKYDGLSKSSTFEEIQTYLQKTGGSHCDHLPCFCHTAVKGERCYESVSWVLEKGIKRHMARYEMLSAKSTREEVQTVLHADRRKHCLLPCAAPWEEADRITF